jgi:hypothetical protein
VAGFEAAPARRDVRLKVDARQAPAGVIRELALLLRDYPGESQVFVTMEMTAGQRVLELGPAYRVAPTPDFFAEVRTLLGEAAVA